MMVMNDTCGYRIFASYELLVRTLSGHVHFLVHQIYLEDPSALVTVRSSLLLGNEEVHGELTYTFFHDGRHDYNARCGRNKAVLQGAYPEQGNTSPQDESS